MSDRGQEREVKVGILKAQEIRVVFHSAYLLDGKPLVGEHCFTPTAEERLFVPAEKGASFTLKEREAMLQIVQLMKQTKEEHDGTQEE